MNERRCRGSQVVRSGHFPVCAQYDERPPFRYDYTMACINARERLRDEAGKYIEAMRKEFLKFEQAFDLLWSAALQVGFPHRPALARSASSFAQDWRKMTEGAMSTLERVV